MCIAYNRAIMRRAPQSREPDLRPLDEHSATRGVTTPLFADITAAIFAWWYRSEGTLSSSAEGQNPRLSWNAVRSPAVVPSANVAIFSFWFAYVITRPLGASSADGFAKNTNGGFALGDPLVSFIALTLFIALVAWITATRRDVQTGYDAESQDHPRPTAVLVTESD
jgi:uncharacterized membrane-anchored protein